MRTFKHKNIDSKYVNFNGRSLLASYIKNW